MKTQNHFLHAGLFITLAVASSACARRTAFKPVQKLSAQVEEQPVVPEIAKVQVQDTTPSYSDASMPYSELGGSGFVVHAEDVYNPTDIEVVLWVTGSGSYATYWETGIGPIFHTQLTDGNAQLTSLQVTRSDTGSAESYAADSWTAISLPSRATVRLSWIVTFASGHLDCLASPMGKYIDHASFKTIKGDGERRIRVTEMGTSREKALADESQRPVELTQSSLSVDLSWGSLVQDVFRYGCWPQ